MTLRQRYRNWILRRRWRKARRNENEPLREFVYLDDVSVYSLVASQVGMIVTELTDTQATSLQNDIAGSVGATAGFAKAEVGSRIQASETQSSQVLRKAIVQTTFKQLRDQLYRYNHESRSLAMRPVVSYQPPAWVRTVADLERAAIEGAVGDWIVDPERLRRGQLVEVEVRLEAEPIFHVGAIVSGVLDIVQDDPAVFGVQNSAELAQMRAINRMLEKLLVGLVPLRGRAVDHEVVELQGKEWLVHRAMLDHLAERPSQVRPLYLVGVAEQALFWKDVRRVLFSGSSYHVLARLAQDGVQRSWTPVKLVEVLRDVMPDVATIIDSTNRDVLATIRGAVTSNPPDSGATRVREVLVTYASLLAERAGVSISDQELEQAELLDVPTADVARTVRELRPCFDPITRFVEARTNVKVDRETASNYRAAAMTHAGLVLDADNRGLAPQSSPDRPLTGERFLDAELVAIYW